MNTTINISLPKELLKDLKKAVKSMRYSSVSELMRDAARDKIYKSNQVTINGFTPEFENEVLRISNTSDEKDVLVKSDQELDNYLKEF